MLDKNDPKWQHQTEEILSGMAEWRKQHSKATFGEIERETMRRIAQLQARSRMRSKDGAARRTRARDASEWGRRSEIETSVCGMSSLRSGDFSP
jgi:hypothetical protein